MRAFTGFSISVAILLFAKGYAEGAVTLTDKAFIPGIVQPNNDSRISGVALSPDGSKLYAAYWTDTSSDPVAVYNTTDNSLLGIPMASGQCHANVVLSQDGRFAYVPTYYGGSVSRIDFQNANATSSLGFGSWATNLSMTPDKNTLLVPYNESSGDPTVNVSIAFVNVAGGAFQTVGSPLSLGQPFASSTPIAFSADSRYAYLATSRSTTQGPRLLEIDLSSQSISRSLALPGDVFSGVVLDNGKLYVAAGDQKKIYTVDLATFARLPQDITLNYPITSMALNPDGRDLFALSHSYNAISVIDLDSSSVSTFDTLPYVKNPLGIQFTADGKTAYVAEAYNQDGLNRGAIAVLGVAPEPSTLSLLGAGAVGLIGWAWRRRRSRG